MKGFVLLWGLVVLTVGAEHSPFPQPELWRTVADEMAAGSGLGLGGAFSNPLAILDVPSGSLLYGHSLRHMPGANEVDQLDADPVVYVQNLFGLRVGWVFTVEGEYGHPSLDGNDPNFPVHDRLEGRLDGVVWALDLFGLRWGGSSINTKWTRNREVANQVRTTQLETVMGLRWGGLRGAWGKSHPLGIRASGGGGACSWSAVGRGCRVGFGPFRLSRGVLMGGDTWGIGVRGWGGTLHYAEGKNLLGILLNEDLPSMRDVHTGAVEIP
ncbi:hypothetical protein H8D30_01610 [bacterium]|nr:hypothetical protein [bacterium]